MKLLKSCLLLVMMITVIGIIYMNNFSTPVSNAPEGYQSCQEIYYHPEFTYKKTNRSVPLRSTFWITTDGNAVTNLLAMPGMSIKLTDDSDNNYFIQFKNHFDGSGAGQSITKDDADFLVDNIDGLKIDGDPVYVDQYIGYINDQLKIIDANEMLGKASGCKGEK